VATELLHADKLTDGHVEVGSCFSHLFHKHL